MARLDARQIQKRSTVPGALPTVPPSNNHLDGSWTVNDIYECELFFNIPDNKVFTRFGVTIIELSGFTPSGSSEVTDFATVLLLTDDSNWTDNIYTGPTITTQLPGDFFITGTHDYKFFTLSGTVTARRIPYGSLIPPSPGFTYTFPFTLS